MPYIPISRPRTYNESAHFVWADGDKTVLSDWSGSDPDNTDDGPLVVDETLPIEVALPEYWAGNVAFIITCHCTRRGGKGRVWTGARTAAVVAERTGQRFKLRPEVALLRDQLNALPLAD